MKSRRLKMMLMTISVILTHGCQATTARAIRPLDGVEKIKEGCRLSENKKEFICGRGVISDVGHMLIDSDAELRKKDARIEALVDETITCKGECSEKLKEWHRRIEIVGTLGVVVGIGLTVIGALVL